MSDNWDYATKHDCFRPGVGVGDDRDHAWLMSHNLGEGEAGVQVDAIFFLSCVRRSKNLRINTERVSNNG